MTKGCELSIEAVLASNQKRRRVKSKTDWKANSMNSFAAGSSISKRPNTQSLQIGLKRTNFTSTPIRPSRNLLRLPVRSHR